MPLQGFANAGLISEGLTTISLAPALRTMRIITQALRNDMCGVKCLQRQQRLSLVMEILC